MSQRYRLVFFLFAVFKATFAFSSADSLQALLKLAGEDTNKVNVLNKLAWKTITSELDKSLEYSKAALALAQKLNFKKGLVNSYNNIGNVNYLRGNYPAALHNYLKGLTIMEELRDKAGIANSLMGVGNIYNAQGDNEQALNYQFKSLKLKEELGDKIGMSHNYNNIGAIYLEQKKFKEALEYQQKSLKIKEELGDKKGMSANLGNIGNIYFELKKYPLALDYQLKALKIREALNNRKGIAMSYSDIGKIYEKQGKLSEAITFFGKSLEAGRGVGYKQAVKNAYAGMSSAYERLNNTAQALKYYKLYAEVKDSIYNAENSEKLIEMETRFETEKKEKEIALLTKDGEIKKLSLSRRDAQIKKQKIVNYSVSGGLALVLLLAFVLYNRNQLKQKANAKLEVAYSQIEEKNKSITDSIKYAKRIQEAILPPDKLVKELLPDSFILYKPKDIVSGDFYFLCPSPNLSPKERGENKGGQETSLPFGERQGASLFPPDKEGKGGVLIAAVDCTGHGVPGAFMSIVGYNLLNRAINELHKTRPAEILDELNKGVSDTLRQNFEDSAVKDGMDISLISIDVPNLRLQFAGAYNPLWIIRNSWADNAEGESARTELIEIKGNKHPVGSFIGEELKRFTNHEVEIRKGDVIYLFSDGYADQFGGPNGKKFKYKKFQS